MDKAPTFESVLEQHNRLLSEMADRSLIFTERDSLRWAEGWAAAMRAIWWRAAVIGVAAFVAGFLLAWGTM